MTKNRRNDPYHVGRRWNQINDFIKMIFPRHALVPVVIPVILLTLTTTTLSSCNVRSAPSDSVIEIEVPRSKPVSLTLTGYNYTNRYIDTFSVDGVGGGNLFVSDGSSGGGGSACCVTHFPGARARKVKIKWNVGACTYNEYADSAGIKHHETYLFFKEADVQVDVNIPSAPKYFEVHFFPDGHVEAALTEHESPVRLILNKDRQDRSHYPRCPNDKKPQE